MSKELGHPEAVTVLAIDLKLPQGGASTIASREAFARLLGGALAQACTLQPAMRQDAEPAYTAVVLESGQTLAILRRLLSIQAEFAQDHPDTVVRFVVHHGLVFAAPGSQPKNYLGSGVRSAHSHLNRLPTPLQRAATDEFVVATQHWDVCPIHFGPLEGDVDQPSAEPLPKMGLMRFTLASESTEEQFQSGAKEDALKRFLSELLASYLGPFAEILVDAAQRSALSPASLVDEVSREIGDLPARIRFKEEAMDFLAKQQDVQSA